MILLWALAAVVALLLALLALPLRFEFRASAGEALGYNIKLRPFGRFGPRLSLADSEKRSNRKTRERKKKRAKTIKMTPRDPKRMVKAALFLVAEIFSRLRFENAILEIKFGAGDPAETGQIYGALTPLVYGSAGSRWLQLRVEPDFDKAIFDGRAALDVSLTPIRLVPPFVRFGWAAFGPNR